MIGIINFLKKKRLDFLFGYKLKSIISIDNLPSEVKILKKVANFDEKDFEYNCFHLEEKPLEKLSTITYENILKNCTNYFSVELNNARFVKGNGRNLVIFENQIIDELSFDGYYDPNKKTSLNYQIRTKVKKKIGVTLCLATTGAEDNYFTFSTKLLQRIGFALSLGFKIEDFDSFFINSTSKRFQKELLKLHGIPLSKVIEIEDNVFYQFEKLIVPSIGLQNVYGNNYVKEKVLSFVNKTDPSVSKKRRIYLSRNDSKWMRVINESFIQPILDKYNIERVTFNNSSVVEQAEIMQSAELFISAHGAGMVNIIYCKPGTKIIELMNRNRINVVYHPYSIYQKLNYSYLLLDSVENNDVKHNTEPYKDIIFRELESLEKVIKHQLAL
jgi:hypothetical protein